MAVTPTGKWTQANDPNSSQQNRDFFSGDVTVDNAAYDDSKEFQFGFAAVEVHVINTGGGTLAYQWLRRKGTSVDNDIVLTMSERVYRNANKQGIRLRHEGGATTARVIAIG